MSYSALDSGFINSTTFRLGPMHAAVWAAILSQKDQDGIVTLTPETLARIWLMDEAVIQKIWDDLAAPDPKSKNKENEGRRMVKTPDGEWYLTGHDKYREKYKQEKRRKQVADATRRWRSKASGEQGGRIFCEIDGCTKEGTEGWEGKYYCSMHAIGIGGQEDREPGEDG